jgi:Tol biopolymer transport system component
MPETDSPSDPPRYELMAVTQDGLEERTVRLTMDPPLTWISDCRWAVDHERRLVDGRVSWVARNFGPHESGTTPAGLYSAQVAFDDAGHITGLAPSSTERLVADTEVHSDLGSATHDWSPDGARVVYAIGPRQAPTLHILDLRTRQSRKLTYGLAPVWSPDGSHIAFRRNHDAILITQPDGAGLQTVAQRPPHPGIEYGYPHPGYYELVWSPDSKALLYGCLELTGGTREIYRIARTGGEAQSLTRSVFEGAMPIAWQLEGGE